MSEIEELQVEDRLSPEDLPVLKRYKNDPEELKHQNQIEMLQAAFPNKYIDPLMASVLLKTPPERLEELLKQPELWITPEGKEEQVLTGCVTIE
jgi:hypothetical protein